MILTRQNVAFYLLERGLLSMKDLVCEGISVSEQFQRNRNFRVSRPGRGGFFVKQPEEWSEWGQRYSTLVREAACYQLARDNAHLEKLLPKFHDFSAQSHVLVVEMIEPARSMNAMHSETGEFPPALAALLGRQLAVCHVEFGKMLRFLDREHPFIGEVPWILKPDDLHDFVSDGQSAGQARLVGIMKNNRQLYEQLKALADTWQINGIIHGDMKWHNCLIHNAESNDPGEAAIRIVDWELADSGHVAWDVAGILQGYLSLWIQSMNLSAECGTVEEMAATAALPLEEMQPSIRAFWEGYVERLDVPAVVVQMLRRRSVEYAAARLLQTAFEDRQEEPLLGAYIVLLMQLSSNIMSEPEAAAEQLLGLPG
ncbi:MAG TPA: phosphotransferase [Pyrinomonadaceae bacterium]|nr:phosphotransferase [Pyrinomonadaceae bacterium]